MPIPNNPLVGSGSNPPSIKSNPSPEKLFGSASTKSRIDAWPYNQSISWYTTRTVSLFLELLTQLLPGTEVSYLHIPGPRVHRVVEVTPLVHPHLHIEHEGVNNGNYFNSFRYFVLKLLPVVHQFYGWHVGFELSETLH